MSHRSVAAALAVSATAAVAAFLLLFVTPSPVQAYPDVEQCFFDLINDARAETGIRPLTWAEDVATYTRVHAARMSVNGGLFHSAPDAVSNALPDGWATWGENVGWHSHPKLPDCGPTHRAFLDSATHRDNILNPDFTAVATGVYVDDRGGLWTAHLFVSHPDLADPIPPVCRTIDDGDRVLVALHPEPNAAGHTLYRWTGRSLWFVTNLEKSTSVAADAASGVLALQTLYADGTLGRPTPCVKAVGTTAQLRRR